MLARVERGGNAWFYAFLRQQSRICGRMGDPRVHGLHPRPHARRGASEASIETGTEAKVADMAAISWALLGSSPDGSANSSTTARGEAHPAARGCWGRSPPSWRLPRR